MKDETQSLAVSCERASVCAHTNTHTHTTKHFYEFFGFDFIFSIFLLCPLNHAHNLVGMCFSCSFICSHFAIWPLNLMVFDGGVEMMRFMLFEFVMLLFLWAQKTIS